VAHRQRRQDHFTHIRRVGWDRPFPVRKEPALLAFAFLLDHLDGALPTLQLRGVQLA
jgi:hypothetical protein